MIVRTPVEGFSGVVANVSFVDGVGESDDSQALSYFRRHGYAVEPREVEKPKPTAKRAPAKPKSDEK